MTDLLTVLLYRSRRGLLLWWYVVIAFAVSDIKLIVVRAGGLFLMGGVLMFFDRAM